MRDLPCFGEEWVVDASGCDAERLRDRGELQALFRDVVRDLRLHPLGRTRWHRFPTPGGYTGLWMLQESHLACHTFPEFESICLNLFCCRPRPRWDWESELARRLRARVVHVRRMIRAYGRTCVREVVP